MSVLPCNVAGAANGAQGVQRQGTRRDRCLSSKAHTWSAGRCACAESGHRTRIYISRGNRYRVANAQDLVAYRSEASGDLRTPIVDKKGVIRHVHPGMEYHDAEPGSGHEHCDRDMAGIREVVAKLLAEQSSSRLLTAPGVQDPQKRRRSDECGDHTDGQLGWTQDRARYGVAYQQKCTSRKKRRRQQASVRTTRERSNQVRNKQADESHGTRHGHRCCGQH